MLLNIPQSFLALCSSLIVLRICQPALLIACLLYTSIQDNSEIPLITKAADYPRLLSSKGCTLFEKDLFASDLYETVLKNKIQENFVSDLKKSPVILTSY